MKQGLPFSIKIIAQTQSFPWKKDQTTTTDFTANSLKEVNEEMKQMKEIHEKLLAFS